VIRAAFAPKPERQVRHHQRVGIVEMTPQRRGEDGELGLGGDSLREPSRGDVVHQVEGDRAARVPGRKDRNHRSRLDVDEAGVAQQAGQRPTDRQVDARQLGRRVEQFE
jgi:hypothetical protein